MLKKFLNPIHVFVFLFFLSLSSWAFAQGSETDLLSAAQQAFNDGFNDVASRYLQDFMDKYPQSTNLHTAQLLLGQCDFLRGQYDTALDLFEGLSDVLEKKDEVLFWRAETYLKKNRLKEAQADYREVITVFPKSSYVPQAYYSLAWSFFQEKNFYQAKIYFTSLLNHFSTHPLSRDALLKVAECDYNMGKLNEAIADFKVLLKLYPRSSHACEAYFNTAESYYYLGQFDEAAVYYEKTIEASCDINTQLTAYTALGWSFIKLSKLSEAQNVLKKALNFCKAKGVSPQEIILVKANLAYEQGDYTQSLLLFSEFIEKYPQSPRWTQGYLGRANVLYVLKRYEEARADYQKLEGQQDIELRQKCQFGLGWCALKLGNTKAAIKHFQEVFDTSTDQESKINALIQMGDVYQESNQWQAAFEIYARVRQLYPVNGMMDYVLYRQGIAFLKLEKIDEAADNFNNLKNNFTNSRYLQDIDYYQGVIAFKNGKWEDSTVMMKHFLKGLSRPSEFTPEANYILALSYLNLKEPEEALKYFQKILRLYPDDAVIAQNADIGIAKCQFELGQDHEAIKRFKMIAFKYPKTDAAFKALLWLAQYYLKNADGDAAIGYYKAMIDNYPDSNQIDQIHYELGQAYEMQGQLDLALEQYKAISTRNESLTGKTRLAIAGIISKELDPKRSIAAYESIIATSPEFASEAYLKLAQLYRNAQAYDKEIAVYKKALQATQGQIDRAQMQFNLADTIELMGNAQDAVAAYLQIADLYPAQLGWVVKAYLRVGKIYEESQDWQAARLTYQKIIQLKSPEAAFAQERLEWIKNNAGKMRVS